MARGEVLQWSSFESAVHAAARLIRETFAPRVALAPVRAAVPVCRCAGTCRCASQVPFLLQRQIEMECEFYREVH